MTATISTENKNNKNNKNTASSTTMEQPTITLPEPLQSSPTPPASTPPGPLPKAGRRWAVPVGVAAMLFVAGVGVVAANSSGSTTEPESPDIGLSQRMQASIDNAVAGQDATFSVASSDFGTLQREGTLQAAPANFDLSQQMIQESIDNALADNAPATPESVGGGYWLPSSPISEVSETIPAPASGLPDGYWAPTAPGGSAVYWGIPTGGPSDAAWTPAADFDPSQFVFCKSSYC